MVEKIWGSTTLGCKDIGNRKPVFVAKIKFLYPVTLYIYPVTLYILEKQNIVVLLNTSLIFRSYN